MNPRDRSTMNHATPPLPAPSAPRVDGLRRARRRRPRWLTVNITPAERAGRIVMGLAGAVVGVVLLVSAASALAIALEVLLMAAGVDLIVTGALGYCPLYHRLGHVPASLASRHG